MTTLLADRTRRARVRHRCNDCDGRIEPGQDYHQQVLVDGADFWTYKAHPSCHRIAIALVREHGYLDDEWPEPAQVLDVVRALLGWLSPAP